MVKKISLFIFILFYGGNSLLSQADKDPIEIANRLMCLLDYEQAVHYYNQAIEQNPDIQGARLSQGYAYFRLRKHDDAIRVLKEELTLFPKNYEAYILLGYIYFMQNRLEDAARIFQEYDKSFRTYLRGKAYRKGFRLPLQITDKRLDRVLAEIRQENPNIGMPNFILGLYYKKAKNFSKAKSNFDLAQKRGHNPIDCTIQLIDIELIREKGEEALEKVQEALRLQGSQSEFFFMMGYIYYQLNEIGNAILCFEKTLELKPYLAEAMKNLSALYYNQHELDKASRLFDRFLRITLYDVYEKYDLKYSLKNLEVSKNLADEMELEYVYLLKDDLQSISKTINETALSLVKNGRLKEAVGVLRNFLHLDDTSPEINYNLGQLYNISNKLDKALKYALRAVELKRNFKDAHDLIGNIYFKIQDYPRSIQSYREVVALDSNDAMGYYNLGCVYHAAEDFEEAEKCWKNAIKHEKGKKRITDKDKISEDELSVSLTVLDRPISFRAHKSLGRLYLDRNWLDRALDEFERAVELEPGDPEPYYELGKIYKAKSERNKKYIEKAIFYFEKYIYVGGKEEEEVEKLLKILKKK